MTETTSAATAANVKSPTSGEQKQAKPKGALFNNKGVNIGILVCAILAVAGIVLWGIQLTGGMVQTSMRNLDSWGLYITMFMFFVGLSAGGLIISSVPKAFGIQGFGAISKIAVFSSIACTIAAIGFVVVDLGQPARLWELFAYSNLASPLMWDIIVLGIYLILSCVYLWAQLKYESGKVSARALRIISVVALICAVLVHSVTAWIFGLQQGREMWYTALLAPWFVSSALVCGTALIICIAIALKKCGYLALEQAHIVKLAKLLGTFVCVDLYFFACDLLTAGFPAASGADIVWMLVAGPLAPFFWIEIIGGIICIVVCFCPRLRTNPLIVIASLLAIIGIFCKRTQLLVGGFQIPNIEWPSAISSSTITNWTAGLSGAYESIVYWPSLLECGITIGVVGLAILIFLLGVK
ncbi:NrfD/PsrC family molybdoenzyme membrane anchor subunit, partial [Adlercreutzia sp. ZJ154]